MADNNILKRYLDAGMAFTAMTQVKAEAMVKELVKTGEVQTDQAQAAVADLLERSRKNTEALVIQVREEVVNSAESLGLATVADLSRVERLIDQIRPGSAKKAPAKKKGTATKKKTAAKKAPAKKATATKKKTAAKKAPAKKATATKKKATATKNKTAAKKAPAKKSELN